MFHFFKKIILHLPSTIDYSFLSGSTWEKNYIMFDHLIELQVLMYIPGHVKKLSAGSFVFYNFVFFLIISFMLMLMSIALLHHVHFSCKDLIDLTSRGCPSLYMKWIGHHSHLSFFSYWRWNLLVLGTGERGMWLGWTWDSFRYVCMEHFGYYD